MQINDDVPLAIIDGLAKLREPFPDRLISKLPKPTCKKEEYDKLPKGKCAECGGWHATSKTVHLDYVGHAALTDRLLDADPFWSWEPLSFTEQGLPRFDETGGLWIKLTVCGHTRLGYGSAASKQWSEVGSREKEVIGDALRNAAMRFGAALELWHKGDLHIEEDNKPDVDAKKNNHKISPKTEAVDAITGSPREPSLRLVADKMIDLMAEGDVVNAAALKTNCENQEEWAFVLSLLPSLVKTALATYMNGKKQSQINAAQKTQALRDAAEKGQPASSGG